MIIYSRSSLLILLKNVSIIIPTFNEAGNIEQLVKRIHHALSSENIRYEIIFIDDHSTDRTIEAVNSLVKKYPLSVYKKIGKKGKAFSLVMGFERAKYDIFCMI